MLIQARPYDGRIIQLCWIQRSFDVRETVGLSWIFHLWVGHRLFHLVMGEIGKSWQIIMLKIHLFLLAMVYIWAISKNPRFTERTSTNLERCNRLPHVCTIMIYGYIWQLGGIACRKKKWFTWFQSGGCASFLIRHLRCRTLSYLKRCYWKMCLANRFFSHLPAWTASLLASHLYTATLQLSGRTSPNAMALTCCPRPYGPEPLPVYLSILGLF